MQTSSNAPRKRSYVRTKLRTSSTTGMSSANGRFPLSSLRAVFRWKPNSRCLNSFTCRYKLGKVLGAGSFGVVREATEKLTKRRFACKTIPKAPKRGACTPRYLLKLQTEVDVMQQLGASLDSVHLKVTADIL